MVSPAHRALRSLPIAAGLLTLTLALVGCEAEGQACRSDVDCYINESCVLGTCVLQDEPDADLDAGDSEQEADIDSDVDADTDTPEDDADTDIPDGPPHPVAISAALNFSCALLSDATVWCWGDNSAGFLSDADGFASTPQKISGFDGAVEIATASGRICARMDNGAVLCRGDGSAGSGAALLTKIDEGATQLNAGTYHFCAAVGADATLHCWGDNGFGQTGDTADPTVDPTAVAGVEGVTHIAAGDFHTCVATTSDEVLCFGDNYADQLGVEGGSSLAPITHPFFSTSTPVFELVAGSSHNCALSDGAEVWCWGDNAFGQLAIDTELLESSAEPDGVELDDALSGLSASDHRTCGIGTGGQVFCWGFDPIDEQVREVHEIPDLVDVEQLAIGQGHTCALTRNHTISCWGKNQLAQLGDGSRVDRIAPEVPVVATWEN